MGGDGNQRDVLLGPKKPLWSCTKCHRKGNWASRIKCACGAAAPVAVAKAAKQAHEQQVAGGANPKGPAGRWSAGAPPSLDKALQAIVKRLEAIEKAPAGLTAATSPPWADKNDSSEEKALKENMRITGTTLSVTKLVVQAKIQTRHSQYETRS